MRQPLTRRDKLLLLATLPLFAVVLVLHVQETAQTGLAQLPVFAKWNPGDYPQLGGFRLETDSSGTGLELGDRLIRIGDRDLRGVGYIGFHAIGLSLTQPSLPVPLVFERGGVRRTVPFEARPHPQRWSRLPILLLIPTVCILLLLRASGQPDAQRFYLCFMTYAIGQAHFYGGPEWKSWAAALVWNLAAPLMLIFMLRWVRDFPREMPDERRVPKSLPWIATGLYLIFVRLNYLLAWPLPIEWVPRLSFASHGLMSVLGVSILAWNYHHAHPPGQRRLRWILLGTALGSVPVVAAGLTPLVVPEWEGFRAAFAIGFLSSAIWMMGAVLAVVRGNAFDVDRLIGATAAWAVAGGGAVAGLALAAPALSSALASALGVDPTTTRLGLAAALGALAIPVGLGLRPLVDRALFPQRVALQDGVELLIDELARCTDRHHLLELGTERTRTLLGARGSGLYERTGRRLRLHRAEGLDLPESLAETATLPERVRPRNAPPDVGPEAAIFVPLRPAGRTDALIVLGPKASGDIYTTGDASALTAIAARIEAEWLRFEMQAADRESLAKTNLLAAAGHDLRQPLHAVSLLAEALGGKLDDPELRRLAERIGASTHDLDEMLASLLDRSMLDTGAVRPTLATVSLADLFVQLDREFAPQAEAAGVRLRVAPTRLAVRSDRLLLARILRNLVSNAIRYAPGGTVLLGARPRGSEVRIEVRDDGPGIPEASQHEIFQAFRQLPGGAAAGLGLGLSIVDGLAHLLEHPLRLRSAPGKGSTFSVTAGRTAPVVATPEVAPAPGVSGGLDGLRVLVVDDDPPAREACTLLLRSWGCEVREAAGAADARAALDGWAPQFVVTDYHLGASETGVAVLETLGEALGSTPPAALVTGETNPARLEELRAAGWPVLRKPVRPAKLRALLSVRP